MKKGDFNCFVVGITGGIASGKSVLCGMLSELGAYIIDADEVSRYVYNNDKECMERLRAAFPSAFSGGELDRAALAGIVFSSDVELTKLNAITHPFIRAEIERRLTECDRKTELVFLAVPLMFEAGFNDLCDVVATVKAERETRINRLMKRNNILREQAESRLNAQASDSERERLADKIIENDGSEETLREHAERFYQWCKTRAERKRTNR